MLSIRENVPLENLTTFRIGGPAKYFVEVRTVADLQEALEYAAEKSLEFFLLGGGSNVLVSDEGFRGLVIRLRLAGIGVDPSNGTIQAEAGVFLSQLVRLAAENRMSGLEWAAGIPGTVGGAVRGNAGAFGGSMGDSIQKVRVLNRADRLISEYTSNECHFGYRTSLFKQDKGLIVLSVSVRLQPVSGEDDLVAKNIRTIRERIAVQPQGSSAGSFFMNPVADKPGIIEAFERDRGVLAKGGKVPAGWLIDQAGLRGKRIGGAMVSDKHPNFILNTGGAKASDVIMLESLIKQQVRDQFGIQLQREVEYVGF